MTNNILAMVLAFVANSMINIGQATQKIGISRITGSTNHPPRRASGTLIWLAAALSMTAATLLTLYAVSMGNVSLVGAMLGSGLVSLTIYSHFVMKEKIHLRELIGVGLIIVSAVLVGLFSKESNESAVSIIHLLWYCAILIGIYVIGWIVSRRSSILGPLLGAFSGVLSGLEVLFQKLSTSQAGRHFALFHLSEGNRPLSGVLSVFLNPFTVAWISLSILSVTVIQFAYHRDKAIRIIPSFSAHYILVPVLGGVICFSDPLALVQWVGVGGILCGVFLLTLRGGVPAFDEYASDKADQ